MEENVGKYLLKKARSEKKIHRKMFEN